MMVVHEKLVRHIYVTVHSEVGRLQESDNLCYYSSALKALLGMFYWQSRTIHGRKRIGSALEFHSTMIPRSIPKRSVN